MTKPEKKQILLQGPELDLMPKDTYLDLIAYLASLGLSVLEMHESHRVKYTTQNNLYSFAMRSDKFSPHLYTRVWRSMNSHYARGQRLMPSYTDEDQMPRWRNEYGPLIILDNPNSEIYGDTPKVIDTLSLVRTVSWMREKLDTVNTTGMVGIGELGYSFLDAYIHEELGDDIIALAGGLHRDYIVESN